MYLQFYINEKGDKVYTTKKESPLGVPTQSAHPVMKMESDFHMAKGDGETSYMNNSTFQQKAMLRAKPELEKAIRDVCAAHLPRTMVVADLGCSSGPNTLMFMSQVIGAVAAEHCSEKQPMEIQFFLNDLPSNDFNHLFNSLKQLDEEVAAAAAAAMNLNRRGETEADPDAVLRPRYYVAGLPGSYYTRIFPDSSVYLFNSSFCLHWRSQMFREMDIKAEEYRNEGNIYIASTTPPCVVKLYQEQFEKDLSLFLKLRAEELVAGGRLLLTFLGREIEDPYNGDQNHMCGLLSLSLQSLVDEGVVEKEKMDTFNLPVYEAYVDEAKAVAERSGLFDVVHAEMFEANWDPDQHGGAAEEDAVAESGRSVANYIRAVMGPLFASHFGECILDELFERFARNVAARLEEEKASEDKCPVIVLSLRKK